MKFFILMVGFVTSLSASTVTSLYHWYGPDKPAAETVDFVRLTGDVYLSRAHQDRRFMMNKIAEEKKQSAQLMAL